MKLFQIEEPDGSPVDRDAPGVAVGIDVEARGIGRVAIALGGNAEILPDAEGSRSLGVSRGESEPAKRLLALLLGLRSRAEKQLARPVTHAVIAAETADAAFIGEAAAAAGLTVLAVVPRAEAAALAGGAAAEEAAVLGAAIRAEDLAPRGE
jgi:hypothetical protein